MIERRLSGKKGVTTQVPQDYLRMVTEVMLNHFDQPWTNLKKADPSLTLTSFGSLYPDEIALCLALTRSGSISALTLTASHDFDPKASQPSAETCLQNCVDALASVLEHTLGLGRTSEELIEGPIAELEGLPLEWSKVEVNGKHVYLHASRANPDLDKEASEWLAKNDPDYNGNEGVTDEELEEIVRESENALDEDDDGEGNPTIH